MEDHEKTQEQLIAELGVLRQQVAQQSAALQRVEAALHESETRYRELVEDSIQGMYIHQDGVIRFANRAFAAFFGYESPEALVGQDYRTLIAPHERPRLEAYREARLRHEPVTKRFEYQGKRKDDTLIWLECMAMLISWHGREAVLAMVLDVTEHKQTEAMLRERETRYRTLVEHSIQGISVVTTDGIRVYANPAMATIFGYDTPYELIGRSVWDNIAPCERNRLAITGQQRLSSESFKSYVYQALKQDGATVWVEAMLCHILWDDAPAFLAMLVDVTTRKQAEEERAARIRQLQTIRAVAEEITRELDLTRLLELIAQRAAELVGVSTSVIRLWDDVQQTLITAAAYNGQSDISPIPIKLGEGVVGSVAEHRQGLVTNLYKDSPYAHPDFLERMGTSSLIAEPLLYRERLIGVLLGIHWEGEPFTVADRDMFALFASEAAISIENARLFEESHRRQAWLSSILGINKRIATSTDLQGLMARITEEACRLVHSSGARIGIRQGDHLVFEGFFHYGVVPDRSVRVPLGDNLLGQVVHGDRAITVTDLQADPRILPVYKQRFAEAGIRSAAFIPIRGPHRVLGVLYVSSQSRRQFQAGEVEALMTYAEQVALAIEHAQLVDAVQQRQTALERTNKTLRGEIAARQQAEDAIRQLNAQLEQRVVERTAQLQAANRELEAFSYSVSHDLRAPLRAIDGFSRILLEDYAPQCDAEVKRYLSLVCEGAQRMGQLIDDLLTFSRVSRQQIAKCRVAPDGLARQALHEVQQLYAGRQVDVVIGALPACQADPVLLKQVWLNLLANALKFTRHRQTARIEIDWCKRHGAYFVRDNGVGFDMRYAEKLFVAFQRLHRVEDYEGTGVGLALAHRIVDRHGGRIWAEAAVDQGATFFFTLGEGEVND